MRKHNMPRRQFLQGAAAAAATLGAGSMWSQGSSRPPVWVLLGSGGDGIYRARWNAETGEVGTPELAVATPSPSFVALHPQLPVVYACNEGNGDAAMVSAFSLGREHAELTAIGGAPAHGDSPCYVSVDRTGKMLFAANYGGGSLAAFPLGAHGEPGTAARVFACAGNSFCGPLGPVSARQDAPHLHCANLSPDNGFALACDLGDDAILVFPIRPGAAEPLRDPLKVAARRGSGPRHLAFHPNGRWLYCVHELDCTVDLYTWKVHGHRANATLVPGSVTSLLPASPAGDGTSTGAEIAITRDGQFLYASTRGVDLLSVFRIDAATGALTGLQQLLCGGRTPRFFALDPTERWLLCAHQDGNSVTVFARDAGTGQLTPGGTQPAKSPQCIVWV